MAPGVKEAMVSCLREAGGNPGRASHRSARAASELLFDARAYVAAMLEATHPERVIFTKNATEALNLAIMGTVRDGDIVAVSSLEHNAVMRPLRWLESNRGVRLHVLQLDANGAPEAGALDALLAARPRLLVLTAASNVTGAMPPIEDIAARCKGAGILVGIDASQACGHRPLSMRDIAADFICFPGHKGLLGPTGTGAMFATPGFDPEPLFRGGTGSVSDSETMPDFVPDCYDAGTANTVGLAGLLASATFILHHGINAIARREHELTSRLIDGFSRLPGIRLYGPALGVARAPVVSLTLDTASVSDIARELDRRDIAIRAGLHCAPAEHRSIGSFEYGGTIRFSPGYFTTDAEIDAAMAAVEEIVAEGMS
jgi:cysteine desulfurase family protein